MIKEINSTIKSIFATPIYISKLNRELTKKELSFIDKNKSISRKSVYNKMSNDSYILNNIEFKNLKKELNLTIQDYFNKIIIPDNNIVPYITQSWLNYTEINESHHKHHHPNSLISGVFYINSDKKFDKIIFFNDIHQIIKPEVKEWNIWNSDCWWFSVETGNIILFPSFLNHMVETKQGNNTRISLAFNVFIKGKIGKKDNLTELNL